MIDIEKFFKDRNREFKEMIEKSPKMSKDIPAEHIEIVMSEEGRVVLHQDGNISTPQAWLAVRILLLMRELDFSYFEALRTVQMLNEVFEKRPNKLPIRSFIDSIDEEWVSMLPDHIIW